MFTLEELKKEKAIDIRYAGKKKHFFPDSRKSKADKEITFTGNVPSFGKVARVLTYNSNNEQEVAEKAKEEAEKQAQSKGGLAKWTEEKNWKK